ncbi:MAG: peptidoglycan-binding LysM [Gammaproteobacteria bacterium]|nr:MAG: peptidoglycan-binding LysM [Gammaproteobacteria bacterium]
MLTKRTLLSLLFGVIFAGIAFADTVKLNPDHPDRYVVVAGDTLWDIAGRFLREPWLWPEIWHINPEIANPHLIYPGDVIALSFREDGTPVLSVERGQATTVKLSPQIRTEDIAQAIPTITPGLIKPFLEQPQVLSKTEYEKAPYVVAGEESRLISGTSNKIYVRGLNEAAGSRYSIVHIGEALRQPGKKEVLGYEAIHAGDAVVEAFGDPATLQIVDAKREVLIGDRLVQVDAKPFEAYFMPRAPGRIVNGNIIAVRDAVSRVGRYQVVVIDLGANDGLESGHVLAIFQKGDTIRDVVSGGKQVTLPERRAGELMVFRTFERVSYALVMEAAYDIRLNDAVKNP